MPTKVAKAFEIERAGKTLVLTPRSNPHEFASVQLDAEANEILKMLDQTPGTSVVMDCQNTDFFNSSTLGFFMQLWLRVRVRDGRMVLCNLSGQEKEVLHLTKADTLWSLCPSRTDALEALRETKAS
jgi:anti-anti-sigma factor